jgi:hypothetical protein
MLAKGLKALGSIRTDKCNPGVAFSVACRTFGNGSSFLIGATSSCSFPEGAVATISVLWNSSPQGHVEPSIESLRTATHERAIDLRNLGRSRHSHDGGQLRAQNLDNPHYARLSERGQPPQIWTPDSHRRGP